MSDETKPELGTLIQPTRSDIINAARHLYKLQQAPKLRALQDAARVAEKEREAVEEEAEKFYAAPFVELLKAFAKFRGDTCTSGVEVRIRSNEVRVEVSLNLRVSRPLTSLPKSLRVRLEKAREKEKEADRVVSELDTTVGSDAIVSRLVLNRLRATPRGSQLLNELMRVASDTYEEPAP
jgi:hypothetical protein